MYIKIIYTLSKNFSKRTYLAVECRTTDKTYSENWNRKYNMPDSFYMLHNIESVFPEANMFRKFAF